MPRAADNTQLAAEQRRQLSPRRGFASIYIVDSPTAQPEGLQKKVAGGRSPRRPPVPDVVEIAPRRVCRKKAFLCVTSVVLGVSVVKFAKEIIHHKVTEDAQRTTEFIFPTDSGGVPDIAVNTPRQIRYRRVDAFEDPT